MKKGQITVFIIIGISLLFIIGAALYLTSRTQEQALELAQISLSEVPERAQPVRDLIHSCLLDATEDGLRRLGASGGYIDQNQLSANPFYTTEGDAVQLAPDAGPNVAYWWYMKSPNTCTADCEFASKRPPLRKADGRNSIEEQLERYVQEQLSECLVGTSEIQGCTLRAIDEPKASVTVADISVITTANYPLQLQCEDQTFSVNDYAIETIVPLREMYELASEITTHQSQTGILEQATNTIIGTFSGIEEDLLPPSRGLKFGGPDAGVFWVEYEVLQQLKGLLTSYIPLIQVFGTKNYKYIESPDVRDPELYELVYNRQFLIPTNKSRRFLEARFAYLDWWEPYFDLNCKGQLCTADSATSFTMLPMTLNRYEFAYDLSYPVLFEIRDPDAFGGEGYTFNIMLEHNMRSSKRFTSNTNITLPPPANNPPSIFCNIDQRTSGEITLTVLNGENRRPLDDVSVTYLCGDQVCNLGKTRDGTFTSRFPRCIGGTLLLSRRDFSSTTRALDTHREEPLRLQALLEPERWVNVSVRNYQITKIDKLSPWKYEAAAGLVRPHSKQQTVILLKRKEEPGAEPFVAVAEILGGKPAEIKLVPGRYEVQITSLLRDNITIPPDERCFTVKKLVSSKKKCFKVPEEPLVFNESTPFPYGTTTYEYTFSPESLHGATGLEFRQFVIAIDKVEEKERVIEDLEQLKMPQLYVESNPALIWPVIKK